MNTANGIYPAHQTALHPSLDQTGGHAPFGQHFGGPNVNPNNFDFANQLPNQPGQRFGDNIANNTSPSVHQSPFQVPSVVPQKRARDDQVSASPHPPQTTLGQSRSQTPQQAAFNQYGAQPGSQAFSTPTPFQQHMHASNHATPSPNPSNHQFRPPTSQPSMSSPQNFPGQHAQAPGFPQMPNQLNRMGTPQNPNNHFMSGMQPGQGLHSAAHGGMGPGGPQIPGQIQNMRPPMQGQNMNPQQQEMMKRYQESMIRQRQMQNLGQMPPGSQSNGMTPQQRAVLAGGLNPNMPGKPGMPPGADRAAPQQQAMQFMSQLQNFLQTRGQQLDPHPSVCGQPVHYFQLFQLFIKLKPQQNPQAWAMILSTLRIPPNQHQQAVQELRSLYDRNLAAFAQHYVQMVERQRQMQQGRMPGQGSPTNEQVPRPPVPPGFPGQTAQLQGPSAGSPALKNRPRAASSIARDSVDRSTPVKAPSVVGQPNSPHQFPQGSPIPLQVSPQDEDDEKTKSDGVSRGKILAQAEDARTLFDPEYKPRRYSLDTHGGLALDVIGEPGALLHEFKTFQRWEELGPVDLHALTMGLQSGFHEEITYALDRLAKLSQRPLYLPECLDLVDSLLDTGREQLQQLVKDGADTITDLQMSPVEELTRCSRDEGYDFRDEYPFGGEDYEKRHAIDNLLAVTTIFRNLSFSLSERHQSDRENDANRKVLTSVDMQSFYARVIRLLHVPTSPLKSNNDHLDIVKDVVVFMSNVSESLVITTEDDARTFLAFLLAFAPKSNAVCGRRKCSFATFEPLKHQYLPNALDSLAKILARDDPNRGLIKTVFHNNLSSVDGKAPLLTKAFALAIAPLPDKPFGGSGSAGPLRSVEKRKPFMSQGMLVLDVLATLVPPPTVGSSPDQENAEPSLQRQWLESEDAWASRIVHLVIAMSMHDAHNPQVERHPVTHEAINSGYGFTSISQRALSMLRRLLEGADKAELEAGRHGADLVSAKVLGTMPLGDMTFSAMMLPRFDAEVIRLLTALSQMVS